MQFSTIPVGIVLNFIICKDGTNTSVANLRCHISTRTLMLELFQRTRNLHLVPPIPEERAMEST